ncbi:MAG: type III PLP-dependent enzyme [bacterium]|nr:type III PLP-dependent enzyme [bacterium]
MDTVRLDTALYNPLVATPALVLDFEAISQTYDRFVDAYRAPQVQGLIFYAMKANANQAVLDLLGRKGAGFEIASLPELDKALAAGAPGEQIICSNPVKTPAFLRRMQAEGVYAVVADSADELDKIAQVAPGMRVYVRLAVDNTGSVLPLAGKFGVDAELALALFDQARDLGLQPIGLSFHVGSQCLNPANWVNAIRACGEVWQAAEARGHHFHFLDIGGGFPAGSYHTPSIPTIEGIACDVMAALEAYIPLRHDLMFVLEPGRGMVGESGRLLATIEGKAIRRTATGDQTWLYLDVGVFNGLMETYEGFPPVVSALDAAGRPLRTYTLAGPSCDSCDVIARNVELPELQIGDRLVFHDAGAYTNEYAAAFNGFPIPQVVVLPEHPSDLAAESDMFHAVLN